MRLSKTLKQAIKEKLESHSEDYIWQAGFRAAIDFLDEHEEEIQLENGASDFQEEALKQIPSPTVPDQPKLTLEAFLQQLSQLTKTEPTSQVSDNSSLTIPVVSPEVREADLLGDTQEGAPSEQPTTSDEVASTPANNPLEKPVTENTDAQAVKEKLEEIAKKAKEEGCYEEEYDEFEDSDA